MLLKRLFLVYYLLLELKEYQVLYIKVLISIFSANLNTIIQVLLFFNII